MLSGESYLIRQPGAETGFESIKVQTIVPRARIQKFCKTITFNCIVKYINIKMVQYPTRKRCQVISYEGERLDY